MTLVRMLAATMNSFRRWKLQLWHLGFISIDAYYWRTWSLLLFLSSSQAHGCPVTSTIPRGHLSFRSPCVLYTSALSTTALKMLLYDQFVDSWRRWDMVFPAMNSQAYGIHPSLPIFQSEPSRKSLYRKLTIAIIGYQIFFPSYDCYSLPSSARNAQTSVYNHLHGGVCLNRAQQLGFPFEGTLNP